MWKVLSPNISRQLLNKYIVITPLRCFLTESFQLKDAWSSRSNSSILKRINVNDMFYELDNQFQSVGCASGLDVDLFVNAINNDMNFDELEDVVHKLRLSSEATSILPSTHHGLIRLYLDYDKIDDLLRILDDRLNYGIFPDDYCSLLIMDKLIKSGNYKDAAKVSTFSMLQEDFTNPILKYMSIYSCHKYLENPVPWNQEIKSEIDEDDDEDAVKVRVKFIRNPYFDDHFDIVNPNHLVGKTLSMIGSEIDDNVGRTCKLIGLLLYEKYEEANNYVKCILSLKQYPLINKDGLTFINTILQQQTVNKEKNDKELTLLEDVQKNFELFSDTQLDCDNSLLSLVENRLKNIVLKNENDEINKQLQLYQEWELNRESLLQEQIALIEKEKELAEIKRQKELLKQKENEIFFFDNEDKMDLMFEEKEKKSAEVVEKRRQRKEMKLVKKKLRVTIKPPPPPLESFFDENIPMKLVKTKL